MTRLAASALVIVAIGCRAGESETAATPAQTANAVRPVVLPDLSHAAQTVRDQVGAADATVRAMQQDPSGDRAALAGAYGALGNVLFAAEYFMAAEAPYLNAEALAPGDFRWPYYLGHLYRRRSEWAPAAAAFERALSINRDDVAALVRLGETRLAQGQPDAAARAFETAVARNPDSTAAVYGLGRAALARQQYAVAVERFERALALDPQASGVRYPLAMAYRGLGNVTAADAQLRVRGNANPRVPDPLLNELNLLLHSAARYDDRAREALGRGDWRGAIQVAREGIALAADNPALEASLRHRLGTALAQTGDADGAFREFERTVRLNPDHARGHYSLGIMLAGAGRGDDAIERLATAVRLDPNYVEARAALDELRRGR
jgi:tetratricopeptide (TPR) repeat protein